MVQEEGVEPTFPFGELDPKSSASANSATLASFSIDIFLATLILFF